MKRIYPLVGLLVLIIVIASCGKSSVKPNPGPGMNLILSATEQQQATADNAFTFSLFKTVHSADNSGSNLFLSPLSVSIALGMTSNGANGATLTAIDTTLGFGNFTQDQINSYYSKLITDLPKLDPQTTLNIANSIWYRQGFGVLSQFLQTNTTDFNAKVEALNFGSPTAVSTINGWVNTQTNGKITKIVDQISAQDVMYLINAIYFKSIWKSKFDVSQTHKQAFYLADNSAVQADFMKGDNISYNGYNTTGFNVLEMPYVNAKYSMVIISPNSGNTVNKLLSNLNATTWQNWMSQLMPITGPVQMPKFQFNYSILLNNALSTLGMSNAFSSSADFTRINAGGNVQISKVQHAAFVAVDEDGTTAAAVTSVGMQASAVANPPLITFDHPFIFVIREMNTGLILFAGIVNNPLLQGS